MEGEGGMGVGGHMRGVKVGGWGWRGRSLEGSRERRRVE